MMESRCETGTGIMIERTSDRRIEGKQRDEENAQQQSSCSQPMWSAAICLVVREQLLQFI